MAVQGTWNIFGWTPPDFGITEAITGGKWGEQALNNPAFQSVPGIYQSPYTNPSVLGNSVNQSTDLMTRNPNPTTNTGGNTGGNNNPNPQPKQPQGYWDKDFGDPNHPDLTNPVKQDAFRRYQEQQQQSQQVQGISESELNDIYSPAFAAIDEQRRSLEAQRPGEEQKIQGSYDRGIEGVTGQESETQMQLAKRGTDSETAQANALANARQLYSELSQRYGAMFGSRSSAGPAAQELLGRETTRRFGEVGTAKEQDRQAIADETARLGTWVNTQKQEWTRKKETALTDLKNVFTQEIGKINAQRGQLESQKARERSQALQNARDKQDAINAADRDFQQRLALFQAEKQSQLTTTPQYGMNQYTSATQNLGQYSGPQTGQQTTNQGMTGTTVAGGQPRYDAYGRLVNERGEIVG